MKEHGDIDNERCRGLLGTSRRQATYLLQKMERQGLLRREGERRWVRYRLP
ncbi:MAG: SelB C-terminal domain-containing protein [Thermodesulfobacteriota bacterium]